MRNLKIKHCCIPIMSAKGGTGKTTQTSAIIRMLDDAGYVVGGLDWDINTPNLNICLFGNNKIQLGDLTLSEEAKINPISFGKQSKVFSVGMLVSHDIPIQFRGQKLFEYCSQTLVSVNWGVVDFLVIDMPPGIGQITYSLIKLLGKKLGGTILISSSEDMALADTKRIIRYCKDRKHPVKILGVVENYGQQVSDCHNAKVICSVCRSPQSLYPYGEVAKIAAEYKVRFLGTIPADPTISRNRHGGKTLDYTKYVVFTNIKTEIERTRQWLKW